MQHSTIVYHTFNLIYHAELQRTFSLAHPWQRNHAESDSTFLWWRILVVVTTIVGHNCFKDRWHRNHHIPRDITTDNSEIMEQASQITWLL